MGDAERFWSKVDRRGSDECWPWQEESRNEHGYGIVHMGRMGRVRKAHRVAYELTHGVVLESAIKVRHSCDNPPCCNPAHLLTGTQGDNVADMHARGRRTYDSRYTASDLEVMRGMSSQGVSQAAIADEFGCSPAYVSLLLSGRRGVTLTKG